MVRIIDKNGNLSPEPWAILDIARPDPSSVGVTGISLAPDFKETGYLYVVAAFPQPDGKALNKLIRFQDVEGFGTSPKTILEGLPTGNFHSGGKVRPNDYIIPSTKIRQFQHIILYGPSQICNEIWNCCYN